MKKKFVWAAIAVGIVAAVFLILGTRKKSEPKYRTAKVDRGDVTQTVTATGTVSAVTSVAVGSQVSGIIAKLHADFNSQVHKGDLLAELDPTPFQEKVNASQAGLDKAQVELRNTQISLNRQKALKKEGLAPQADYDQAQANYDSARASVQQAAASLKQAETDLKYTKIVAPIDGVVVARQYDVGQTVAASFQAPTLFTIAQDLTRMQVEASVDEADIGRIRAETPVTFTVDAFPGQVFTGTVSQIRKAPLVAQNVVTYTVVVAVANPAARLVPGMTASVRFVTEQKDDVLKVPNAALRFRPPGAPGSTTPVVWVLGADGRPAAVPVTLGITDGTSTEIVRGDVQAGQIVLIGLGSAAPTTTAPGPGFRL